MPDFTLTLSEEDWAMVVSGLVRASFDSALAVPERQSYSRVGKQIVDQCPQGSLPWWGGPLLAPTEGHDG